MPKVNIKKYVLAEIKELNGRHLYETHPAGYLTWILARSELTAMYERLFGVKRALEDSDIPKRERDVLEAYANDLSKRIEKHFRPKVFNPAYTRSQEIKAALDSAHDAETFGRWLFPPEETDTGNVQPVQLPDGVLQLFS